MPKGPLTTKYIGGSVAGQLSKKAATIIGSTKPTCTFLKTFRILMRHNDYTIIKWSEKRVLIIYDQNSRIRRRIRLFLVRKCLNSNANYVLFSLFSVRIFSLILNRINFIITCRCGEI